MARLRTECVQAAGVTVRRELVPALEIDDLANATEETVVRRASLRIGEPLLFRCLARLT